MPKRSCRPADATSLAKDSGLCSTGSLLVVTVGQLVPSHVQAVFARSEHGEMKISSTKLAAAIKKHAGHADGAGVDLTEASAAVAKAVAMEKKGKNMLERVEPILSNLEALFAENPNIAQIYRDSEGTFHPGPAAVVTKAIWWRG